MVVAFCRLENRKKKENAERVDDVLLFVCVVNRSRAGGRASIQLGQAAVSDVFLHSRDRRSLSHRPRRDDPAERSGRLNLGPQNLSPLIFPPAPPFARRLHFISV